MDHLAARDYISKRLFPFWPIRDELQMGKSDFITSDCFSSHRVVGIDWSLIDKSHPLRPTVNTGPLMIRWGFCHSKKKDTIIVRTKALYHKNSKNKRQSEKNIVKKKTEQGKNWTCRQQNSFSVDWKTRSFLQKIPLSAYCQTLKRNLQTFRQHKELIAMFDSPDYTGKVASPMEPLKSAS